MKKRLYPAIMAATLSITMTMQSFAAGWVKLENDWNWFDVNNNKLTESWHQDGDGTWYYLDAEGKMQTGWKLDPAGNLFYLNPDEGAPMGSMVTGWKLINATWHFFNTVHDGTYGRVLTGWQWIDGYCYYFSSDGKMSSNAVTPDGFQVNENGAWIDNGSVVYVNGKGVITKVSSNSATSSNKGSSGGGGGGGGSSSTSSKTYSYTVTCIDKSTDKVLGTYKLSAKKNAMVALDYDFEEYQLIPGQATSVSVSENNMVFNLYYEKNVDIPETKYLSYKIIYKDIDSDEILDTGTFKGEKDEEVSIDYPYIEGYEECGNQPETFVLDSDNKIITVYYQMVTTVEEYFFTVRYIDRDGSAILGEKTGVVTSGSKVILDFPTFNGYEVERSQNKTYTISENGLAIIVYYNKKNDPETATPSEPEIEKYSYTINCYAFETGELIGSYMDQADAGEIIEIYYPIIGYTACESYSFEIDEDDMCFDIYYTKDEIIGEYSYAIYQIDMTTKQALGQLQYQGTIGEEIELSGIEIEGYELLGNPPDTIKISSMESNNELNLYYKKLSNYTTEPVEVNFTIEFVDYDNLETKILNDVYGTGNVGDEIPIYFYETITTSNGKIWKSVGSSPRIFELIATDYNLFTIEYRTTSEEIVEEDALKQYSICYVAEDTGATLGITTGYAEIGKKISFRNNLGTSEYGISDSTTTKLTISNNEADNHIVVPYKRVSFPGPETDPITGEYKGNNWTVVFVDNEGTHLLQSINGFSLANTTLIIDYPDEIEIDGDVYRAKNASPYREVQPGTVYHQIAIEYSKGEEAQNKLDIWKQTAQEAKDEIFGTTPMSYYVIYKETNSWNDIGLRMGVAQKNSYVSVPTPDITDYTSPTEKVDGFTLSSDGIQKTVYYSKFSSGTSVSKIKTSYQIYIQDEYGNDLFEPHVGYVASDADESTTKLPVYYPNSFTDKEGNLWEADESSPASLVIDALSQNGNINIITYHKTFENPKNDMVVASSQEALSIFENITSRISDSSEKKFYLIGKDYSPNNMNPTTIMAAFNLANYSNEIVDMFMLDGVTYYVTEIHISRTWLETNCVHHWNVTRTTSGTCLVNGSEALECDKCGKSVTTIIPAVGHIDQDHDSICDTCNLRAFNQILGDEILVDFESDSGTRTYTFVCIDDDYNGTGKMLYLCEDDLPASVYGVYSYNAQYRFEDSVLRSFLNDSFADGLSLKNALQVMGQDRVSILTKDEVDFYKINAENKYLFPTGIYLTKTNSGDTIVLSDGNEVSADEAINYPVRPVILLDKPTEGEAPSYTWQAGDVQAREIAGEIYLFRCVSESYKDKTNTSKKMALFICDSIIPANVIDDASTGVIETLFFGDTNNYKYSNIKSWLDSNVTDQLFDTTSVNIGVDAAYSGSTQANGFSNLNERLLTKYNLSSTQYIESRLFILSVEEALQIKDHLWKFGETDSDNPDYQMKPYCYSYWLRTPEYNTTDKIYVVNLETGRIETKDVTSSSDNFYSETGIRPVFAMTQYE